MNKWIKYLSLFLVFFLLISFAGGKFLLEGINRFYGLTQHSDILLVGHSHLMLAVDKKQLEEETGNKVSKYTREGVNVIDRYYMVKQYLDSKYSDSLKIIFYGVDSYTFTRAGLSDNSYKLFYPFMSDPVMESFIKENEKSAYDYYKYKFSPLTRYSDVLINASFRGWRNDFANYKFGAIDIDAFRNQVKNNGKQFNRDIEMDSALVAIFEQTMDKITQRKIRVILVNTPLVDVLNQANPDQDKVIAYYQEYAQTNDLVEYWDFNPKFSSEYSLFYDPIHLNPQGQSAITKELIKRLKNES